MAPDNPDPHPPSQSENIWPTVSAPKHSAQIPSLKQRFGDWYQNAPMGFHSLDANGTIIDINDTELDWLGYRRDEVVGRMHISALLSEKSKEVLRNAATRPHTYGGSGYLEYEAVRKDGAGWNRQHRDERLHGRLTQSRR